MLLFGHIFARRATKKVREQQNLRVKIIYQIRASARKNWSLRFAHSRSYKNSSTMIILPSLYLAPIQYYARLYALHNSDEMGIIDLSEHYLKQTYRNRCMIASADGPLALTIPVEGMPREMGGTSHTPMSQIRISEHGRWRQLHWRALVAAYEASPYFDYYADDFEHLYQTRFDLLADLNAAFQALVLDLLDLKPKIDVHSGEYLRSENTDETEDFRQIITPKREWRTDHAFCARPYHQVFGDRLGFLPNLSIADLLFNMGPETRLVLRDALK